MKGERRKGERSEGRGSRVGMVVSEEERRERKIGKREERREVKVKERKRR